MLTAAGLEVVAGPHPTIEGAVRELSVVAFRPGVKNPAAIGFKTDEIARLISIEEALASHDQEIAGRKCVRRALARRLAKAVVYQAD